MSEENNTLSVIKALMSRATKNMSDYKTKYEKQLSVSPNSSSSDLTENITVNKLKKLLSKYDVDKSVYLYDENTMQEKSIGLDKKTSKIEFTNKNQSITVKELNELLDKLEWNHYLTVDNKYGLSNIITESTKKTNKVILSLKTLNETNK